MKKFITILLAASIAAVALAQPHGGKRAGCKEGAEKVKAEKVAFITSEVGLTVEEAQAFWPVYNEIDEKQQELRKAERQAFKALNKALESGEGDVQALLDAYLKAKADNVNLHAQNVKKYQKVLSVEKTAKFFTCEEKFRRQQIGKLGGEGKGCSGFDRQGPGKGRGEHGAPGKGGRWDGKPVNEFMAQ